MIHQRPGVYLNSECLDHSLQSIIITIKRNKQTHEQSQSALRWSPWQCVFQEALWRETGRPTFVSEVLLILHQKIGFPLGCFSTPGFRRALLGSSKRMLTISDIRITVSRPQILWPKQHRRVSLSSEILRTSWLRQQPIQVVYNFVYSGCYWTLLC